MHAFFSNNAQCFHLASLLVLDDGQVAFVLALADEVEANALFFGMILIGSNLFELTDALSGMFRHPPWSLRSGNILWFGFDLTDVDEAFRMVELCELVLGSDASSNSDAERSWFTNAVDLHELCSGFKV